MKVKSLEAWLIGLVIESICASRLLDSALNKRLMIDFDEGLFVLSVVNGSYGLSGSRKLFLPSDNCICKFYCKGKFSCLVDLRVLYCC